jgi:hypothetical protein
LLCGEDDTVFAAFSYLGEALEIWDNIRTMNDEKKINEVIRIYRDRVRMIREKYKKNIEQIHTKAKHALLIKKNL